jgi:hypothetical protein
VLRKLRFENGNQDNLLYLLYKLIAVCHIRFSIPIAIHTRLIPPYFHPLLINSNIPNFLINHLILIHLIYFHDFMILFFAFPYFLFLPRFFLLSSYYSSHLFHLIFSTSHSIILLSPIFFFLPLFSLSLPHFFSSLPIIPLLIYFNLFFPLCIQLFSSHLFILHLFHLIFIPSLHTPLSLSLSLTTPHLLFFFFFFFSLSPPHLPRYMLFRWTVAVSSSSSV